MTLSKAEAFRASGPLADRVTEFARRWATTNQLQAEPACHIHVTSAPHQHTGLGVGTQLGLSVAAGLNGLYNLPIPKPVELAMSVGEDCDRRWERTALPKGVSSLTAES